MYNNINYKYQWMYSVQGALSHIKIISLINFDTNIIQLYFQQKMKTEDECSKSGWIKCIIPYLDQTKLTEFYKDTLGKIFLPSKHNSLCFKYLLWS